VISQDSARRYTQCLQRGGRRFTVVQTAWIWVLWSALFASTQATGQPIVSAQADRTEVTVNEPFWLTIVAQGSRVAEPVLPEAEGIRIDSGRVSRRSSTSLQTVNKQTVQVNQRQWRYRVLAMRPGRLRIPRIAIHIDGQEYLTDEIVLTATEARAVRPDPPRKPAAAPASRRTDDSLPKLDDGVIIESTVDKRRVYQGEAVELQLRVLVLNAAGLGANYNGRSIPLPSTEGFYVGPILQDTDVEARNGWEYRVQRARQLLFPTGTGTFVIGPWSWQGDIWGSTRQGLQHRYLSLRTDPIEIEVKPLPERPANFTGAVGRFRVKASVLRAEIVQGTPTELVIRIQGQGNPDAIGAPELPPIPWAQLSEPRIDKSAGDDSDWTQVAKAFVYTLIPLEAGNLLVPPIEFCYFAPVIGGYRTDTTDPIEVHVTPSGEGDRLVIVGGIHDPRDRVIEVVGDDLLPIATEIGRLARRRSQAPAVALALLGPPGLYAGSVVVMRRRRRLRGDLGYARAYTARARMRKRLKGALRAASPAEAIFHVMAGYIADLWNLNEAGLTSLDIRELLEREGVTQDVVDNYVKVMHVCERERYAAANLRVEEFQALAQGAKAALERLSSFLRGRPRS